MTMQTLVGGVHYGIPPAIFGFSGTPTSSTFVIDASGEKVHYVFQAPKAGSIRKIGFLTGTVTTSDSLDVGVYTVDGSGVPTSTAYGGMVKGTQASVATNTAYTVTLGTDSTIVSVGDIIAIGITFTSYVAGNLQIAAVSAGSTSKMFPYALSNGSKSNLMPCMWVEWSDGTYAFIPDLLPASVNITSTAFNNASAADEIGLAFTLPFAARIAGVGVVGVAAAATTYDLVLYSGTTNVSSVTFDSDQQASTSTRVQIRMLTTPYTLSANTKYRAVLKPNGATNVTILSFTAPSSAALNQIEGGSNFYYTSRVDAGAWSDQTAQRVFMWVILDQIDDGAGSGGGSANLMNGKL